MKRRLFFALTAVTLICLAVLPARAGDEVVLSVDLGETQVTLSMDDIMAFDTDEFTTSTIWTDGPQAFKGVPLAVLLGHLEVSSGTIVATAINDYAVEIPVSDAVEGGPIVAYLQNGEPMSVRDKGPLWIVYPYDQNEDYQSEVIYSRSIWQLDRMAIEE